LKYFPNLSSERQQRRAMILRLVYFVLAFFMLVHPSDGEEQKGFSLRIENIDRAILLDLPLKKGEYFYLHYIHSSDQTPIRDTFQISAEGQLVLIEEAFLWYGAGLEFQNHNDIQITLDEKWSKVQLNRAFPELVIRVGRVAGQRFIYRDRFIHLNHLVRPGECIILSVGR